MRARDVMSRPVRTVRPDTSIEEAAAMVSEHGFAAAPVVDASGALVGIVSEADLLYHRVPPDLTTFLKRSSQETLPERPRQVADVMSESVVTAYPGTDLADIADQMLQHQVRSVPVVEDGEVVGIVSRRDILRTMVRTDDAITAEAQHRLDQYAGNRPRWTVHTSDGVARIEGDFDDEIERQIAAVIVRTVPGVSDVRVTQPARNR